MSLNEQLITTVPICTYNREQAQEFLAHQQMIDTLVFSDRTAESRAEMLNECRYLFRDNSEMLSAIDTFDLAGDSVSILAWYTRDTFLFRLVNQALRSGDAQAMFNVRYILSDLYHQLQSVYERHRRADDQSDEVKFYRGQMMSPSELEKFLQLRGAIISINTFFSTTVSLQVALYFAEAILSDNSSIAVLFCIDTGSSSGQERPYAHISQFSTFKDEEEVLFAMGSVFRVGAVEMLDGNSDIPVIHLQTIAAKDIDQTGSP